MDSNLVNGIESWKSRREFGIIVASSERWWPVNQLFFSLFQFFGCFFADEQEVVPGRKVAQTFWTL